MKAPETVGRLLPSWLQTGAPKSLIPELEGLRGVLAWWVVFHHICLLTNAVPFLRPIPILGHVLQNGSRAVGLFMILSGFFISGSLWREGTTWGGFMMRRVRRVYPAYLVALLFAGAALPYVLPGLHRLPWQDWIVIHDQNASNELVVHHPLTVSSLYLTLTQGLHPVAVLGKPLLQPMEFLGPSWSLSLEMQFYLVMPFLVGMFWRGGWSVYAGLFTVMGMVLFGQLACGTENEGPLGPYPLLFALPSFLPMSANLFFLGGVSLMARRAWLKGGWNGVPWRLKGLFVAAVLLVGSQYPVDCLLWLVIFAGTVPGVLHATIGRLLRTEPLVYLGTISYSTYIFHITIVNLVVISLASVLPHLTEIRAFFLTCLFAPPLILLASVVLYRQVEHRFYR